MRIMVIGAGDIGMPIIHYLSERGHLMTVIETSEERCKEITNHSDAVIFCASGTDPNVWKTTEADKADALLALTNKDEANLKACAIAKKQFGIPFVVARAHQPENIASLKKAGADIVICPSMETRRLFINALENLSAEILYEDTMANFKIVKATIPLNGTIIGKNVDDLGVPEDCRILSIFRNGTMVFPTKDFILKGGDKVMLSGSIELVEKITEKLRIAEIT